MVEELVESPQVFSIEDSYRIEDEFIFASETSNTKSFLQPSKHSELPARLSDLHNGEDQDVLDFTSKYGLLGYTEMYVTSLSKPQKKKFYESDAKWGDRIDWIKAHSACIYRIIILLELLKEGNSSDISHFLKDWKSTSPLPFKDKGITYPSGLSGQSFFVYQGDIQSNNEAWQTIIRIINSNTSPYISEVLHHPEQNSGPIVRSYTSKSLLPLVYRHLGDLSTGLIKYYKCAYRKCSKRWTANPDGRGPRNKYCPPDIGKASLCSRKERYERSKNKSGGMK